MLDKIEVVHIVATDLNGCIGNNGELPWHLPADLKRFKELTGGGVVIMGRKTFESLNCKPLPNRINIVITGNPIYQLDHMCTGTFFYTSVDSAIEKAKYEAMVLGLKEVWIIGGQSIYEQTMSYVDRIEQTLIMDSYKGDTYYIRPANAININYPVAIVDTKIGVTYQFLSFKVNKDMTVKPSLDIKQIVIPKGTINLSTGKVLGRKYDSNKPRYSLLPENTVLNVVQVLEYGAVKYEPGNWKHVPDARTRYYDAAMRHIDDWWNGSEIDEESSLPHLAHAICCLLFLLWFDDQE